MRARRWRDRRRAEARRGRHRGGGAREGHGGGGGDERGGGVGAGGAGEGAGGGGGIARRQGRGVEASAERDRLSRQVVSLQQELLAASERVDKQRTRWQQQTEAFGEHEAIVARLQAQLDETEASYREAKGARKSPRPRRARCARS